MVQWENDAVSLHAETWAVRFADGRSVEVTVTQYADADRRWWAARSDWPGLPYRLATGGDTAERAVNRLVASGISNSDETTAVGVRAIVPPATAPSIAPNEHDGAAA